MHGDSDPLAEWPAGMLIRVTSHPPSLLELLWLRHHAVQNAAPALPSADLPEVEPSIESQEVCDRWTSAWGVALEYVRVTQQVDPVALHERRHLWEVPRATKLAEELGVSLDEAVPWRQSLDSSEDGELHVVPALRSAWERGLAVVIELPLKGDYFNRISPDTLVVSSRTRANPSAYATALGSV